MRQIWKDIEEYEGIYQVSSLGNVKSLRRNINMRLRTDGDGYLLVGLSKDSKTKTFRVHRLVARAFVLNPKNKETVNHINCLKNDNRSVNLEWLSRLENLCHARFLGLIGSPNGEKQHLAKLTEKQVLEIREKYIPYKYTTKMLSKEYGVSQPTIFKIVANKSWKHI